MLVQVDAVSAALQITNGVEPNADDLKVLKAEPERIESKSRRQLEEVLCCGIGESENRAPIAIIWGVVRYHDVFGAHEHRFGVRICPDNTMVRLNQALYEESTWLCHSKGGLF